MGRVRPEIVKRTARELLEKYRKAFTNDFEHNKQMVMKLTTVKSKKLRNKIAGYITHLAKREEVL